MSNQKPKCTVMALCYRSGEIIFRKKDVKGTLICALPKPDDTDKTFKDRVSVRARLAYNGKTLLVPGVPEAETDGEAHEAVKRFKEWSAK